MSTYTYMIKNPITGLHLVRTREEYDIYVNL